jgi:hypothetical protein
MYQASNEVIMPCGPSNMLTLNSAFVKLLLVNIFCAATVNSFVDLSALHLLFYCSIHGNLSRIFQLARIILMCEGVIAVRVQLDLKVISYLKKVTYFLILHE